MGARSIGLVAVVGVLTATLTATAPAAQADVRETDPCGGATIDGVMVSGHVWLAGCSENTMRSADSGATWTPTAFPAFFGDVGTAADGTGGFWAQDGYKLIRMDSSGVITKVSSSPTMAHLALDGSGQLWGLNCPSITPDGGPWRLYTVNKVTGATSLVADGGQQYGCWNLSHSEPLRVDATGHIFVPHGPASKLVPNGAGGFADLPLAPFTTSGGVTLSEGGVGGVGWDPGLNATAVPGHPDYVLINGEGLYRRDGDGVWGWTRRRFVATAGDLVLVPSVDHTRLQVVNGPLDDAILVDEAQPAESQQFIAHANLMRAQAGLATRLIGDPLIAQAATNHARYWTLNDPTNQGAGLHNERPGQPGFTGASMFDRCQSVGTVCTTEVMYPQVDTAAQAVAGWIATIYHRKYLMTPGSPMSGGGLVGGMAVFNTEPSAGSIGRPFGYPTGVYTGPRSFAGEIPDPGQDCEPGSGKATAPYGTAITVTPPLTNGYQSPGKTSPDRMTVTDNAGKRLAGCLVDSEDGNPGFLPEAPLQPNTTYTASASWSGRYPDYTWTFTTTDGTPEPDTTTPTRKKTLRIKVTKRGAHRIRIDANPDRTGAYRLRVQRQTKRWKTVKRVRLAAPNHVKTVRLTKPGRYRITGVAQAGLKAGHSRTITIR